jgi:hypothetical protein
LDVGGFLDEGGSLDAMRLLEKDGLFHGGFLAEGNCWREIAEGIKWIAKGRIAERKRIAEGELLKRG